MLWGNIALKEKYREAVGKGVEVSWHVKRCGL